MTTAKKKKISEEIKFEKGKEGEQIVQQALEEALDILRIKYRIYNNVYLQFPSSYGNKYGFTTEVDHVVVTDQFIFVVETKNQSYYNDFFKESRNNEYWHLNDDKHTTVINPMIQNYYHKMVLSEQLGIDREAILQIVCLKDIPPDKRSHPYEDYRCINSRYLLFEDENFVDILCKLFISRNQNHGYDFEDILIKMNAIVRRQSLFKDYHIENLERADKILDYQFGTKIKLSTTDCAICPKCNSVMRLFLDDMPRLPGMKRRRHKYNTILRCSNKECNFKSDFNRKGIEIKVKSNGYSMLPSREIVNSDIKIQTIEERLGYTMPETYQKTVLDEIGSLKTEIKLLEKESVRFKSLYNEKQEKIKYLETELKETKWKCSRMDSELRRYRHFFGSLYFKSNKN